jgi:hypothetical protein
MDGGDHRHLEIDLDRPDHQRDVLALTAAYALDPMGNGAALAEEELGRLIPGTPKPPHDRGSPYASEDYRIVTRWAVARLVEPCRPVCTFSVPSLAREVFVSRRGVVRLPASSAGQPSLRVLPLVVLPAVRS